MPGTAIPGTPPSGTRVPGTAVPVEAAPRTARARARAELTVEIKDTARRHLATQGAAALSLRAVARDLGMASSAVYRYFASRDELLTALIIDAYDAVGATAERADADAVRDAVDIGTRWLLVCRAVRSWALAHPQEFALVYGSPVVGYAAPVDTVEPATRIARVLAAVTADAVREGALEPSAHPLPGPRLLEPGVVELAGGIPDAPFEDVIERSLTMWIALVGAINFELFGHLHQVVTDKVAFFDVAMAVAAEGAGLIVPLAAGPAPRKRPERRPVSRRR